VAQAASPEAALRRSQTAACNADALAGSTGDADDFDFSHVRSRRKR
jgi:hypothetical protein